MTSIHTRKLQLETRLADLESRLVGIEAELDSHQTQDWEELATEREGDEVLEGMGVSGQLEIRQIKAALQRISAGAAEHDPAETLRHEAEVEADFDNMPV